MEIRPTKRIQQSKAVGRLSIADNRVENKRKKLASMIIQNLLKQVLDYQTLNSFGGIFRNMISLIELSRLGIIDQKSVSKTFNHKPSTFNHTMNHQDHVNLLRKGIPSPGGVWADLGSGSGAFTLALAELIGPDGEIYSVDRDRAALQEQERALKALFPKLAVHLLATDFTQPLNLPPLDGIVMANSLHFQKHKEPVLERIENYLRPGGHFILVEYNVDRGNIWVPYPLSYPTWEALAKRTGFAHTRLLATIPSRFLGEIFSADSW